jgi:hypothetical protein
MNSKTRITGVAAAFAVAGDSVDFGGLSSGSLIGNGSGVWGLTARRGHLDLHRKQRFTNLGGRA